MLTVVGTSPQLTQKWSVTWESDSSPPPGFSTWPILGQNLLSSSTLAVAQTLKSPNFKPLLIDIFSKWILFPSFFTFVFLASFLLLCAHVWLCWMVLQTRHCASGRQNLVMFPSKWKEIQLKSHSKVGKKNCHEGCVRRTEENPYPDFKGPGKAVVKAGYSEFILRKDRKWETFKNIPQTNSWSLCLPNLIVLLQAKFDYHLNYFISDCSRFCYWIWKKDCIYREAQNQNKGM